MRVRVLKLIAVLSLLGFIISAATTPAPDGYFVTFHSVFPVYTWVFFGSVIVSSILLVANSIFSEQRSTSWRYGVITLSTAYSVYLFLPRYLGRQFWSPPRSDMFAHFSESRYTVETGEIAADVTYPNVHTLMAQVSMITGISVESTHHLMLLVNVLLVVGLALLARELTGNRRVTLGVVLAGCALVYGKYHYGILPWFVSMSLIPLILWVAERTRVTSSRQWQIGLFVLGLGLITMHPFTGVVFLALMSIFWILPFIERHLTTSPTTERRLQEGYSPVLILLLGGVYYLMFIIRGGVDKHIQAIILGILAGDSGTASQAGDAGESGYTLGQLVWYYLIQDWGAALLVLGVGGLIGIAIVISLLRKRQASYAALSFAALAGAGICLAVLMAAVDLVATGVIRINQISIMGALLLIGYAIGMTATDRVSIPAQTPIALALVAVICLAAIGGASTIYSEKRHVIESEYAGMEHAMDYQNLDHSSQKHSTTHRLTTYVIGYQELQRIGYDQLAFGGDSEPPPRRLGYDENETIATTVDETTYVHTLDRDRLWIATEPENRHPVIFYYTEEDLERLSNDPAADRIYANGGYEISQVEPAEDDQSE